MNDREYFKLNTSIQTASNAKSLIKDADGNLEAKIEMRLPDNIFNTGGPTRKIETAEMQCSKFRISMEHTPIAQVTLDTELSNDTTKATTCQLDVYPFCLLDDNQLSPSDPVSAKNTLAFPHYKDHKIEYNIKLAQFDSEGEITDYILLEYVSVTANSGEQGFPTDNKFYQLLKTAKVFQQTNHMMNMCIQSNHEPYIMSGKNVLLHNIGTLEQMFQDAVENAMTYASLSDKQVINVILADSLNLPENIQSQINLDNSLFIDDISRNAYFWKWEKDEAQSEITNHLKYACKPRVILKEQSLTIEYDSAVFDEIVPILWNTPFVDTFDHPEQLTIDTLRNSVWSQPPPKRVYQYGVTNSDDSYNFKLLTNTSCACTNIICNEGMRNTFSFLPWIKVDTKQMPAFNTSEESSENYIWRLSRETKTTQSHHDITQQNFNSGESYAYNTETYSGVESLDYVGVKVIHYQFEINPDESPDDLTLRRNQSINLGTMVFERINGEIICYTPYEPIVVDDATINITNIHYSNDKNLEAPKDTIVSSDTTISTSNGDPTTYPNMTDFVKYFHCKNYLDNGDDAYVLGKQPYDDWAGTTFTNKWIPPTPPDYVHESLVAGGTKKQYHYEWRLDSFATPHAMYIDYQVDHYTVPYTVIPIRVTTTNTAVTDKIENNTEQEITFNIHSDTTTVKNQQYQYIVSFGNEWDANTNQYKLPLTFGRLQNNLYYNNQGISISDIAVLYTYLTPENDYDNRYDQRIEYGTFITESNSSEYIYVETTESTPTYVETTTISDDQLSQDQTLKVGTSSITNPNNITEYAYLNHEILGVTRWSNYIAQSTKFKINGQETLPYYQSSGEFYDSNVQAVFFPSSIPTVSQTATVQVQGKTMVLHVEGWTLDQSSWNFCTGPETDYNHIKIGRAHV